MIERTIVGVLLLSMIIFALYLLVVIIFLIIHKKRVTLNNEDYNAMSDKYIIDNKEKFSKIAIQKAQQRWDDYLTKKI